MSKKALKTVEIVNLNTNTRGLIGITSAIRRLVKSSRELTKDCDNKTFSVDEGREMVIQRVSNGNSLPSYNIRISSPREEMERD